MHRIISTAVAAAALALTPALTLGQAAGAVAERPNVIIFFSDDQGTLDLNVYGSDDLYTPHLDALARSGVRFTQFYAASSVCSPSRAGLLTGRDPVRAGVPSNSESHPSHFGNRGGLPVEEVTIAEMLRDTGYRTALFGKWHLGTEPGPNGHGFQESFGFLGGVVDKWSHFNYGQGPWGLAPKWHDLYRNGEEVWEPGVHTGDLIAREAVRFIEESGERPFFLYLAFGNPHYPVQGYGRFMDRFAHLPEPRRSYAAALATMDEQIGRVVGALEARGLREKTLIVFQSDHGHSVEAAASHGAGNPGPYRGAKGSFFEAGIRVPAIASLPGLVPRGQVRDQVAHGTDWLPTIAAFAGVSLPDRPLDGRSLREVILSDAASPHEVLHWQLGAADDAPWAVREGPWKLLGNPRDPRSEEPLPELFLADLASDPTESTNLAAAHPERVDQLLRRRAEWLVSLTHTHAGEPVVRPQRDGGP